MPVQSTHPAETLSDLVADDVRAVLLKTPPTLLIEDPVYHNRLTELRNDYRYAYVVQWIYLLRHLVKITENFDVETFEEELLGIASPVFVNTFVTRMVQYLANFKLDNFDAQVNDALDHVSARYYEEYDPIDYFALDPIGKTELFHNLIQLANIKSRDNFRKSVDQYAKPQHDLRLEPVYAYTEDRELNEWFVLEDSRVYYRKTEYPSMEVPKRRADAKKAIRDPAETFADIEPVLVEWRCETAGIYQFDQYLKELKQKAGKKTSSHEYKLYGSLKGFVEQVAQHDLKKRRQALQRRREIQMQALLANRKRSSRLEAKEKQKQEEDEKKREEEERLRAHAAEMRAQKRMKLKEEMYQASRTERLQRRHRGTESSEPKDVTEDDTTQGPEPNAHGVHDNASDDTIDEQSEGPGSAAESPIVERVTIQAPSRIDAAQER
ncbi:hypothetical protein KL949_002060 [Ogataea haglerorum]|nr:hypothetical protein KL913_002078 [Ogataea haglerorum]KAG7720095.1 hypothetical protein KL949_002060 [Ogataea haglerorum]KAG7768550.1 hypothetical protein KL931_003156 [Ogataea haglerorum]